LNNVLSTRSGFFDREKNAGLFKGKDDGDNGCGGGGDNESEELADFTPFVILLNILPIEARKPDDCVLLEEFEEFDICNYKCAIGWYKYS
jgi:hypothetical protein